MRGRGAAGAGGESPALCFELWFGIGECFRGVALTAAPERPDSGFLVDCTIVAAEQRAAREAAVWPG